MYSTRVYHRPKNKRPCHQLQEPPLYWIAAAEFGMCICRPPRERERCILTITMIACSAYVAVRYGCVSSIAVMTCTDPGLHPADMIRPWRPPWQWPWPAAVSLKSLKICTNGCSHDYTTRHIKGKNDIQKRHHIELCVTAAEIAFVLLAPAASGESEEDMCTRPCVLNTLQQRIHAAALRDCGTGCQRVTEDQPALATVGN